MPHQAFSGQPFTGSVSLTNATPAASLVMYTIGKTGGAPTAYTPAADEWCVITNISMSSNDNAVSAPLVTLQDAATNFRVLYRAYVGTTVTGAATEAPAPGKLVGLKGSAPYASASAVTAGKTVEVVVRGYITKTL